MIHPTADVDESATIGNGTSVWHRAQVREGVVIGSECVVGKDVYVDHDVRIGDRVKIQNGTLIYHGVTVESGVFIGPGAILTNDRFPRSITAHGTLATVDDWTLDQTTLRYGCSIGAGAIVVAGVEIGSFATVGAGAVVTRSVADHQLVVGNPARPAGWVCVCGRPLLDDHGGRLSSRGPAAGRCARDGHRYVIENGSLRRAVATST